MVLALPLALEQIVRDLRASGFHAVVVGGSVRDALLGLQPKDFDIEVYGMSYDHLAEFLSNRGRVDLVGKSFGVIKFNESGSDSCDTCDFSIPRRDSKTGPGHRDFHAEFDESITPREAASRTQ
jgi:tRNA nucleotidyltransferase (CCA-adding enzyme)